MNMNILLDTHIALWAVADTGKLSGDVIEILESVENKVFYSIVSEAARVFENLE